ncbi:MULTISPECIES: hypothetical protein [unclassified Microbacterium]|uniref:FMN-binding protein n=1 Tax=unclassified Microbacterium TaxID=2609290 RepID=UPI00214ADB89|nr:MULTISPECIES: hypothetical protein [unclassified Microbacterium]MCR2784308.1 hypothetical protein [Microbacterium sp. zg.B96]MDL5350784.1 hypothetical protein [Microbacterium sp. zg-YB36]WIM14864.1 hypothetical protein QNO11_09880 [Microbacterium sp. zg-B96]
MTRITAIPRSTRRTAAFAGVAGALLLTGCGGAADNSDSAADAGSDAATGEASYADGTYEASGAYATPESVEEIQVTVELSGDVITAVEVVGNPTRGESQRYQGEFIGGIADEVVGKDIDEISVSRVAGSSLTSGGFNEAIEQIKADAAQ